MGTLSWLVPLQKRFFNENGTYTPSHNEQMEVVQHIGFMGFTRGLILRVEKSEVLGSTDDDSGWDIYTIFVSLPDPEGCYRKPVLYEYSFTRGINSPGSGKLLIV